MSNSFNEGSDNRDQFRKEYAAEQNASAGSRSSRSKWLFGCVGAFLLVMLIFGGSACSTYNGLTGKQQVVKNQFSNIDVQLQRRADLIPNLVNTVKGYTQHEEKVFGDIAAARSQLLNAKTVDEKAEANNQVSATLGRLLMLTENYPNLKADAQFIKLQDELAGTENRIGVARRDYNQAVLDYNTSRQRFPAVVMANILGFQREEEFKADPASRAAPTVNFEPNK